MSDTILSQPQSTSLLQPTKFQLSFKRLPDVQYFVQKFTLPGGSIQALEQPTPFKNRPVPGNKLSYETLTITFLVEETMNSWNEIHTWLKNLGIETDYQDYRNLRRMINVAKDDAFPQYSDATLTVLSTQNNPRIRFNFKDCFPVRLGNIEFDTEQSAEDVMKCEAEFAFFYYELERIDG